MSFRAAVAVALAGGFRGTPNTSTEFACALVTPLVAAGLRVDVFAVGDGYDEARWRDWVKPAAPHSFTFVAHGPPVRSVNDSHFHCVRFRVGFRDEPSLCSASLPTQARVEAAPMET